MFDVKTLPWKLETFSRFRVATIDIRDISFYILKYKGISTNDQYKCIWNVEYK